jgi:biopolymer transport protein TolQ
MVNRLNEVFSFTATLVDSAAGQAASGEPARLDPVELVLGASLPVKAVLVVLVLFSVLCWFVIGMKMMHLGRAQREAEQFLKDYDKARSFEEVARAASERTTAPQARIFATAYNELLRMTGGRLGVLDDATATRLDAVVRRATMGEMNHLESWMALLGTIGSTSPFIGLFGTVYGIMDAFLSIGNQQSANLPVVAPKIAEALIATGVGLVAAIPAVMAYNYFARRIGVVADGFDAFGDEVVARAKLGGV